MTVIGGSRAIAGFEIPALKEALDLRSDVPRDLSATELLAKYHVLYEGAKRAVLQIPDERLDWVTPQKERRGQTLRQLAFHLFDRPDVCMDAARTKQFTYEMIHQYERLANNYQTTREIVEYADVILRRLDHFLTDQTGLPETVVEAYFGPKTVLQLLNLTLSGTALRIKQIYYFLRAIGVEPARPLGDRDFSGFPVPQKLFG